MEQAQAMDRAIYGEEHYEVIEDLYDLVGLYGRDLDHATSIEYMLRVISLAEVVLLENHPIVANAYNTLTNAEKRLGN